MTSTHVPDLPIAKRSRFREWVLLIVAFAVLGWSLPRPVLRDVLVGRSGETSEKSSAGSPSRVVTANGRLSFRSVRRLSELAAKGPLADETELSGPCLADDGRSLYFARSRPGQRADILLAHREGERWSRAEPVRELNSVDDDRRVTIDAKGQTLLLASNRSGTRGGFDLYESSRARDHWNKPKNVGDKLNTENDEFDPTLSGDGLTLYFVRKSAGKTADIFESHRKTIDAEWSVPQPVVAVNSSSSHERSPAIFPDGKFLYFASNRAARSGEESQFDLFRAPLENGVVGTPVRVQEGIASSADDVDAAFSPDGHTLVFASRREGPKQLYLSHADVVVSRWSWDAEHLTRFGRATWAVPTFCGVFFLWIVRRMLRPAMTARNRTTETREVAEKSKSVKTEKSLPPKRAVEPTVSPERRVATIEQPQQRSSASTNPLANWPTNSATSTNSSSASTSSKTTDSSSKSGSKRLARAADSIVPIPPARAHRGRRALEVVVSVALVAAWLIVLKPNWRLPDEPAAPDHESLIAVVQFRDISAIRQAEQKPLVRSATVRVIAPSIANEPSELSTLRQAAQWPIVLMSVRSKPMIDRIAEEPPELTRMVKQLIVARQGILGSMLSSREAAADGVNLVAVNIVPEKVIGAANTPVAKQLVDISVQQRTQLPPAVISSSALRLPQSHAVQWSLASTINELKTASQVGAAWPRAGTTSRVNLATELPATELPQTEMSSPLSVATVSDRPFVPLTMAINRSVIADVGSVPVLAMLPLTAAKIVAQPSLVSDSNRAATELIHRKSNVTATMLKPAAELKLAPLLEDPLARTSTTTSTNVESLAVAKTSPLNRADFSTIGPTPIAAFVSDSGFSKWLSRVSLAQQVNLSQAVAETRIEPATSIVPTTASIPRQTKESTAAAITEEVKPIDP